MLLMFGNLKKFEPHASSEKYFLRRIQCTQLRVLQQTIRNMQHAGIFLGDTPAARHSVLNSDT